MFNLKKEEQLVKITYLNDEVEYGATRGNGITAIGFIFSPDINPKSMVIIHPSQTKRIELTEIDDGELNV